MPGAPSVNTAANFPRRGEDRQDRGHGGVRVRSSDDQRSLKYPPLPIMGTMEILCTSLVSINFPLSSVGKMQFVLSFVWGLNHNPGCGVTGASCEPPWMTSHPVTLLTSPRVPGVISGVLGMAPGPWLLPISGRMGVPSPEEALSPLAALSSGIAHAARAFLAKIETFS